MCTFPLADGVDPVTMVAGGCLAIGLVGAIGAGVAAGTATLPAAGLWGWLYTEHAMLKFFWAFACSEGDLARVQLMPLRLGYTTTQPGFSGSAAASVAASASTFCNAAAKVVVPVFIR